MYRGRTTPITSEAQNGVLFTVAILTNLGGRIDHAHHASNAHRSLVDTIAFADAVQAAVNITDESDTLIVTTADHSHVFTVGGYPTRGDNILGLTSIFIKPL